MSRRVVRQIQGLHSVLVDLHRPHIRPCGAPWSTSTRVTASDISRQKEPYAEDPEQIMDAKEGNEDRQQSLSNLPFRRTLYDVAFSPSAHLPDLLASRQRPRARAISAQVLRHVVSIFRPKYGICTGSSTREGQTNWHSTVLTGTGTHSMKPPFPDSTRRQD